MLADFWEGFDEGVCKGARMRTGLVNAIAQLLRRLITRLRVRHARRSSSGRERDWIRPSGSTHSRRTSIG